jgi:hypothetical protein
MRYWYTDAGEWAAHSLDDSDWIWLRSGDYWGYLRGDVVHDRVRIWGSCGVTVTAW